MDFSEENKKSTNPISQLIKNQTNAIVRLYNSVKTNYYGIGKNAIESAVIKVMTNSKKEPELNRNTHSAAHLLVKPFITDMALDENGNNLIQWDNPIYCYILSPKKKFIKYTHDTHTAVECFSIRKDLLRNIKAAIDSGNILNYQFIYFRQNKENKIDSIYKIPFSYIWDRYEQIENVLKEQGTIVKSAEEKDYIFIRLNLLEDYKCIYNNSELSNELKNQKFFYNNKGGFNIVHYLINGADMLGNCTYTEYRKGLTANVVFTENGEKLNKTPITFKSAGELYDFLIQRNLITCSIDTIQRKIKAGKSIELSNGMIIEIVPETKVQKDNYELDTEVNIESLVLKASNSQIWNNSIEPEKVLLQCTN